MGESTRVAIIGGGVAGCSIAYHLVKLGCRDVTLLEKADLTAGATSHSAGMVGQLRSSVSLTRMMMYSAELYGRLNQETGSDPEWHRVGSLRLASSGDRMDELRRQAGWARTFGLEMHLLGPRETLDLFPLISDKGVVGAAYIPSDGYLDPANLACALAAGARQGGARIRTDAEVRGILVRNGRVHAVVTNQGTLDVEVVVNAAGMWAHEIGGMAGVNVPVIPMSHQYLVTLPMAAVRRGLPSLRDPDLLVYFREEVGGLVMGGYERRPAPWGLEGIPPDFSGRLLEPDWDRFEDLMANALVRMPALADARVIKLINGPEAFTPDGEFLLGESPDVKGFFVAAGFCAHGIAGAGGVGKVMAEWILEGQPGLDLWRMDLRRFAPHYADRRHCLAQVNEVYATYYDIRYPFEERRAGRGLRLSPVYGRLKELGAVFGEKAGWERPNWIATNRPDHPVREPSGWARVHWSPSIAAEHEAVRERAGLFDFTSFSKFEVLGPGAFALLQRLTDNDLDKPEGSITYTQMLNERGGIECDLTVTRLAGDRFRLVTGSAFGTHDMAWVGRHLPEDGSVEVRDVTSSLACLGLWGPRARDILQKVTPDDVSNRAFPFMTARHLRVGRLPVFAVRVTYVGELGWELYVPMEQGLPLWDALWEAGRPLGLVAAGYRAVESMRLEKGYRYWSADITPEYTPHEAGLGFCVRPGKGDFIGRRALESAKPTRRLCCITLADSSVEALGGEPVLVGGRVVGRVTSGGYGYTVGRSIAYGYLPLECAGKGTRVVVEIFDRPVDAVVDADPLFDPAGRRIKC